MELCISFSSTRATVRADFMERVTYPLVAAARIVAGNHLKCPISQCSAHSQQANYLPKRSPAWLRPPGAPGGTHLSVRHPLASAVYFLIVCVPTLFHLEIVLALCIFVCIQPGRCRDSARACRRLSVLLRRPRPLACSVSARWHRRGTRQLDASRRSGRGYSPFYCTYDKA